jgi:hypothetical protein
MESFFAAADRSLGVLSLAKEVEFLARSACDDCPFDP